MAHRYQLADRRCALDGAALRPRDAGFSLLEMLAALALLAVLITITYASLAQIGRSLVQMRDSDGLSRIANSLLDDRRDQRLRPGLRRGVTEEGTRWAERISLIPAQQGQLPVFRVELQLEAPGKAPWVLSTLMVQAPAPDEALP